MSVKLKLIESVIKSGICVNCGVCLVDVPLKKGFMIRSSSDLKPRFDDDVDIDYLFWEACPGKGIDYPWLYKKHYGCLPDDWRIGIVESMWVGYVADSKIRAISSSGGVTSSILIYLLETNRIDGAVLVRQGIPNAEEASYVIARSREEILACSQSVYIPVSTLDALREFSPNQRYAITCLPEQSAALRVLQQYNHPKALQIKYILGPYTGTSLEYGAIRSLLRSKKINDSDKISSLKWRAGEWPGYLEIIMSSGQVVKSKKVYYNYLIPFYITQSSLQSMDFANEFTDLSVGDAWSPKFEKIGQGFSVVAARNSEILMIINEMISKKLLVFEKVDVLEASAMHGHMIDFKKRGSYLRNKWKRFKKNSFPDYGLEPTSIGFSRIIVEIFICILFFLCRKKISRWLMERIPEKVLGYLFNRLRLIWKGFSKPAKRKGLKELRMNTVTPYWRNQ